jgi:hypothetical protein
MLQAVNNSACRRVARSTDLIFLKSFLNTATSPTAKQRPIQVSETVPEIKEAMVGKFHALFLLFHSHCGIVWGKGE